MIILQVRILTVSTDMSAAGAEAATLDSGDTITGLFWSPGGHMLAATTSSGAVHCFLGVLPRVTATSEGCVAHLTSLAECAITDCVHAGARAVAVPLLAAPHCLALGRSHLLASVNNCVYAHRVASPLEPPHVRTYSGGSIEAMQASSTHVALLMDQRVTVHALEADSEHVTPYREQDVADFALTDEFLIIATSKGQLQHYAVRPGACDPLNEYRHSKKERAVGIERVWAVSGSVQMLFLDSAGKAYLFSPVNDQVRADARACVTCSASVGQISREVHAQRARRAQIVDSSYSDIVVRLWNAAEC